MVFHVMRTGGRSTSPRVNDMMQSPIDPRISSSFTEGGRMAETLPERLVAWSQNRWVRRAALATYVLILLGLTGAYIGISRMQVETAVYLKGDATLSKAHDNPVRGTVLYAPTGRQRTDTTLHLHLVPRAEDASAPDDRSGAGRDESGQRSTERYARKLERARANGAVVSRWSVDPDATGLIEAALPAPTEAETGPYWLYLELTGGGVDTFVARRAAWVEERGFGDIEPVPPRSYRVERDRKQAVDDGPVANRSGPIAIDLVPQDGVVPRGLKSSVLLRTYRAETGEPVRASVRFESVEASAGRAAGRKPDYQAVDTDRHGLASIDVQAIGDQRWHLVAVPKSPESFSKDDADTPDAEHTPGRSTATIQVITVTSQTAFSLESAVVEAGAQTSRSSRTVTGETSSLFRRGRMFGDLYHGDIWVGATSDSFRGYTSRLEWVVPPVDSPRLFRAQVHRDMYVPASAWDSRYLAALPDRQVEALAGAIQRVYERGMEEDVIASEAAAAYHEHIIDSADSWKQDSSPPRSELLTLLEAGLRSLPRGFTAAPTLFNTRQADRKALEERIAEAQSDLMVYTAIVLLIALLGVGAVVVHEIRKRRQHADEMRAVDVEIESTADKLAETGGDSTQAPDEPGPAGEVDLPSVQSSWLESLLTVVILATFVLFAVGFLLVLSYM